jgi:cell division protein FtsB
MTSETVAACSNSSTHSRYPRSTPSRGHAAHALHPFRLDSLTGISPRSLQDRAHADKDQAALATLDETIDLWNKMWMADFVHDNKIVANVQALVAHCSTACRTLAALLASVVRLHPATVDRAELDAAREEARRLATECAALRAALADSVPRSEFTTLQADADRLRRQIDGMVPRAALDASLEDARLAQAECGRLRAQLAAAVPKADLDLARDEAARLAADCERLRQQLAGMVSREAMERTDAAAAAQRARAEALERRVAELVEELAGLRGAPAPPLLAFPAGGGAGGFTMTLSAQDPGALVYYSLDGSLPGPGGGGGEGDGGEGGG